MTIVIGASRVGKGAKRVQSKQDAKLEISLLEFPEKTQADLSLGSMHLVHLISRNMREVTCVVADYSKSRR